MGVTITRWHVHAVAPCSPTSPQRTSWGFWGPALLRWRLRRGAGDLYSAGGPSRSLAASAFLRKLSRLWRGPPPGNATTRPLRWKPHLGKVPPQLAAKRRSPGGKSRHGLIWTTRREGERARQARGACPLPWDRACPCVDPVLTRASTASGLSAYPIESTGS